jgi:hypothetical protein
LGEGGLSGFLLADLFTGALAAAFEFATDEHAYGENFVVVGAFFGFFLAGQKYLVRGIATTGLK